MNENKSDIKSSLFYYLPSVSDRKEVINQHKNNVSLFPVNVTLELIESFSSEGVLFKPDVKCCMVCLTTLLNLAIKI